MAHHYSIHYVPTVRGAVIGFDHFTRDTEYVAVALESLDVLDGRTPSCTLDLVYLWLVASTTSDYDREEFLNQGKASQAMPFYLYCETYEMFLQAALVISDAWSNGVFNRSLLASEFPGIVTAFPAPPAPEEPTLFGMPFAKVFDTFDTRAGNVDYDHPVLQRETFERYRAEGIARKLPWHDAYTRETK